MIEVFEGADGQHYFRVVGANGEKQAVSEGYTRREDAIRGANDMVASLVAEATTPSVEVKIVEEVAPGGAEQG